MSGLRNKYVILKYLRTSSDDGDKEESNSIANQRRLIDFYIGRTFSDTDYETTELVDDGYTGTNMNRPGMKRLLVMAQTHTVDCIIVKDFSRFARDYVETGSYAEKKFPEWGIRFISVNDKYDSSDYLGSTGGIEMALKNIVYTMYSRDLSEKIKSSKRMQCRQGRFTGSYAFYGYIKSPYDRSGIVVDEYAAENVRRIFSMRIAGIPVSKIAAQLNREGILTPALYKKSVDPLCRSWIGAGNYALWTADTVYRILRDERYTGKLISIKRETAAVGSSVRKRVGDDDRIVALNAHKPIIGQELFNAVQKARRGRRNTVKAAQASLGGLVCCGGCKHKMSSYGRETSAVRYFCSYAKYDENNECFRSKIDEGDLCKIVFAALKTELKKSAEPSKVHRRLDGAVKAIKKELENVSRKIAVQKDLKKNYYIELTKGKITEQEFQRLYDNAGREIDSLKAEYNDLKDRKLYAEKLSALKLFQGYIGDRELNCEAIAGLVRAVYVYPDNRVVIQWNFRQND